ncbi:FAD:protein FMN transferase [Flavobacterium cellulosilyticum]|uniref:FAD:protein FMN transferase n=1 Tax=Flavobacterium cellulosilyticum TaxID=2541731 RepID=A0A4V2YYV9_9FLAO|nr:FAD:protein FMN transferase [Flavobacterium cellulosilyticum]TDD94727.1 FAD:protein FMN transferase [Flavobacterium cellulosilyticum]
MTKFLYPILISFLFISCNSNKKSLLKIEGNAQGTTYHISYVSNDGINYKTAIDSLLKEIDKSMSTWLPSSIISKINNNDKNVIVDPYFIDVFNKSIEVSKKTDGLFDVTVGPLVNSWGFGTTKKASMDGKKIDSLLQFVGYKMVKLQGNKIAKAKPEVKLDFNAIAQGYSVDVLGNYLESKGIFNYLVEVGGELKAKGKKENENWKVGIDKPDEKASSERKLEAVINLKDKALATSGNYRKFYEEGGQKFSHIINPKTGYPAKQNLLSTTVIANDCITADAYATVFMVMGLKKSIQFLQDNKDLQLEVYFVYDDHGIWKTYTSESLKKWIKELP